MWQVEYSDNGKRVRHPDGFKSRKAARHWCRRALKPFMALITPEGKVEPFTAGV